MIPLKCLSFEHYGHQNREHGQRYHFLDDLQLHEIERASVFCETYSVRRYLCAVFKKCYSPREKNDCNKRPA